MYVFSAAVTMTTDVLIGSIVIGVPLLMAVDLEHSCSIAQGSIGLLSDGAWVVSLLL